VIAQPGDVRIVSLPFESRIVRLNVSAGEQVSAGSALADVEASPAGLIAFQEAKNAAAAAERDLKMTQTRFENHLATNVELSQAQVALETARLRLGTMTQQGVGQAQTLKADAAAVVSKIDAQEGQIVPAGGPLVELAAGNRIEVSLGVEPDDAIACKVGDAVKIKPVGSSADAIEGKVRVIAQRVDPATRLTSVLVTLPPQTHLMLETFVQAEMTRSAQDALIIPREALTTSDEGDAEVFTIDGDHAKKHTVKIGLENERESQIISGDLKAGDGIVVLGNYHLEDGSEIKIEHRPATMEAAQ
jgi:RND family efflux transporter MFP subunit